MKRSELAVLFFVCSSLGCAPQWSRPTLQPWVPPIDSTICVDLPSEQLKPAAEAAATWNAAISRWRRFRVHNGLNADCDVVVIEGELQPADETKRAVAWTVDMGGSVIVMRRGWYERHTSDIMVHELGHVLGAQHIQGTLMNPTFVTGRLACPDVVTVAQVAAWNHVDLGLFRWCY